MKEEWDGFQPARVYIRCCHILGEVAFLSFGCEERDGRWTGKSWNWKISLGYLYSCFDLNCFAYLERESTRCFDTCSSAVSLDVGVVAGLCW